MAKARKRRSRRKLVGKRFTQTQPLGTLGSLTVVQSNIDDGSVLLEDFFCMSVHATWSLKAFTIAAGDGPIIVGFNHGDYTATEVKEALEVSFLGPDKKIEQERNRRLVRIVGTLQPDGADGEVVGAKLNDGAVVKTKLNWTIESGSNLEVFAYNAGSGGLATGCIQDCIGTAWGRWLV